MASVRIEAVILDEHRNGTGNLQMTLAPLRWAAALAGRRAQSQALCFPGEFDAEREVKVGADREVGVDRIVQLQQLALAQILNRDLDEFLDDEIGRRGGITHRRPPEVD